MPVDKAAAGDVAADKAAGARGGETACRGRGRVYGRKRRTFSETAVRSVPAQEAASERKGRARAARREAAQTRGRT